MCQDREPKKDLLLKSRFRRRGENWGSWRLVTDTVSSDFCFQRGPYSGFGPRILQCPVLTIVRTVLAVAEGTSVLRACCRQLPPPSSSLFCNHQTALLPLHLPIGMGTTLSNNGTLAAKAAEGDNSDRQTRGMGANQALMSLSRGTGPLLSIHIFPLVAHNPYYLHKVCRTAALASPGS